MVWRSSRKLDLPKTGNTLDGGLEAVYREGECLLLLKRSDISTSEEIKSELGEEKVNTVKPANSTFQDPVYIHVGM